MRLKKINAILALLAIVSLLAHMSYNVFCYATMYYNPFLKQIFAYPPLIIICLHAVLGLSLLVVPTDGIAVDPYPDLNRATIIQRISAILIFPTLIVHLNTFSILEATAASQRVAFFIVIFIEIFFFAIVLAHVATSFTRALITLGWLTSMETKQKIDRVVYIIMAVVFVISVIIIVRGQLAIFS